MITGDKQETAINIAIACKLVHHPDSLIVINAADSNEAARARLEEALQHCSERHAAHVGLPPIFTSSYLKGDREAIRSFEIYDSTCVLQAEAAAEMVVDGRTLSRILGTDAEPLLAELANRCSGVVVCRASPSQKAAIVHMMKRFQTAQATVRPSLKFFGPVAMVLVHAAEACQRWDPLLAQHAATSRWKGCDRRSCTCRLFWVFHLARQRQHSTIETTMKFYASRPWTSSWN